MKRAPKSAPDPAPQPAPRSTRITGEATRGDHGLWHIKGTHYQFTKNKAGYFCIYAPGCPEDGIEFARIIDS